MATILLGHTLTQLSYKVKRTGIPGLKGSEIEKLYTEGTDWLEGDAFSGELCKNAS